MIDEREPGSEFAAAVAVTRARTNGRARVAEVLRSLEPPAEAPRATPPTPESPAGPGVPDRRPNRPSGNGQAGSSDDGIDFPARLTGAMHAAARAYRDRLAEELELRRVAVLADIRDQRRADALRARQEAAKNRRGVDAWAATAHRQITSERQRRKVELDADLKRTLRDQNRLAARRVKEIEAALAAHRAELEAFFDAIERERDPLTIAERGRRRPAFPDLDATASPPPSSSAATD